MNESEEIAKKLNFDKAEFLQSASKLNDAPHDTGSEVAFAGRSNSGKSSAINTLTGRNKLARTSRTPGRTQLINFFALNDTHRIVDLPGYGFAKVPLAVKKKWGVQIEKYLRYRQSLCGLVLLMDIRHPLSAQDQHIIDWAIISSMPVHILLTKSDKLKRGPAKDILLSIQRQLSSHTELVSAQTFSSLRRVGVEQLEKKIARWLHTKAVLDHKQEERTEY